MVSGLSYAGFLNANAYNIDAYWLCLIPQAAFLLTATTKKIEFQRIEERAVEARESRAQNSLARLKQSKESADQARLLRVIERERELMAELREREMQRTDEMRKAKDMADHANQAKSAFLAVVSHEIRTPMTGIMGILRLFKDTKLSRDQADYLFAIQKSGDTMMALLNDILDFEKIESGNMQLEHIDFDLPRLAQGVMTLMSGHAATKNLNLKADIAEDFPRSLRGDPTRLRQVLLNLVNNAIKFTEKGDVTIRVRATKRDKTAAIKGDYEVYIAVEDMGIGISEEAQVKLFTPFQQADSSVARKYGGTGLGLAICQRLVEAMGSAIRLTSATGKGSTFFFTLLMEKGKAETIEENEGAIAANVEKTPSKNILVIEDNDINRKVMQNFLEKDGHRITAIAGGEEAADLCMANKFDVILMDINLNGMSGFETIKTIRALPDRQKANAPIIAITGNTLQAEIEEILNAGFNDYLSKPIDFDRLLEMIGDAHKGKYAQTSAEQTSAPTAVKSFESFEDYDDFDLDEDSFTVAENFLNKPAEQSSKPNDDSVFNVQMMDKLKKSLGKEQMDQLMFGFVEKSDEIVQALGEDIKATNIESIRDRAHELKGMGGNFGLSELSKIAGEIEKACKNNDMSVVAAQIQKLPAANARAKDAIKNWLS